MKKGFGARERRGLIVFCTVVVFFLAIGPIAERFGCTSVSSEKPSSAVAEISSEASSKVSDSVRKHNETDDLRKAGADSIREKRSKDKAKKGRRAGKKKGQKPADPGRRSYLDEPI